MIHLGCFDCKYSLHFTFHRSSEEAFIVNCHSALRRTTHADPPQRLWVRWCQSRAGIYL